MASPGTPLLTVVDMDPAVVEVALPEKVYPLVEVGQEVEVEVQGEKFTGKVRSKDMTVDPAKKTYLLKVEIPNPDGKLASGMTASVFIPEKGAEKGLLIPAEAYMDSEEAGRGSVMVYKNGVVEERTVTIGQMTTRQVQVLSGLSVGEKVVTKGQHLLKDGDKVKVADAPSSAKPEEK
jgi:RND family efflux transporter MFP subunit